MTTLQNYQKEQLVCIIQRSLFLSDMKTTEMFRFKSFLNLIYKKMIVKNLEDLYWDEDFKEILLQEYHDYRERKTPYKNCTYDIEKRFAKNVIKKYLNSIKSIMVSD